MNRLIYNRLYSFSLVSANFIARYGGFKFTEASNEGKYRELRLTQWKNIKVESETPKFQGGFFLQNGLRASSE